MAEEHPYRLFSWEHSYFSGKVRAYLRYKQRMGGLKPGFEDILATNELGERTLASPAVADNALFYRTEKHLWRFN